MAELTAKDVYREALRKPKWQRKRLKIMERDGWKCSACAADDKNLQVHHLRYLPDSWNKPWESPDEDLVTLCEDCHLREGFRLAWIDEAERDDELCEWSVWFRADLRELAREESNNGAYVWPEPNRRLPNARVSRNTLQTEYPSGPLQVAQRLELAKAAIESLIANCGSASA